MAYSRSRNRSRSRGAKNAPMVASPHTPILTVGVLVAVGLSCFGLPGMPVLLAAVAVAWLAARAPQLTGTDPWKRTCANTPAEQRRDTSYKWMRSWFRHLSRNLDPRNPMATLTVGVACLMGALVWARCGAWWAWANMVSTLILIGARPTRPARLIATGQRPVTWARKHLAAIAMCMLTGLLAGLALWMVTDNPWLIPAMVCLWAPLPMRRAWLAARRQAKHDREAAAMLTGWLLALDKAVVDQPPYRLDNTVHGEHGEIVCRLAVSRAQPWQDKQVRDLLRAQANQSNMDVAFVLDGDDTLHVICNLAPLETCPPDELIADETGLRCRANMETARLGFNYNAYVGDSKLKQVGERDGRPACWVWRMNGGTANSDWEMIRRDWLRGSSAGELGDWGTLIGVTMIVDPGLDHAWLYTGELDTIGFDEDKAGREHTQSFSANTMGDTAAYLRLAVRAQDDMNLWEDALAGAKLPAPMQILYDRRVGADRLTAQDGRWALEDTPMSIPTKGGYQAADYMRVDVRPAFGDSTVADLIGMSANGKWFTRYMRFVQTVPANSPNTPVQLRALVGDGPAERLLAQVIISRAFAQTLKHAAYVGPATQCARNGMGWTLWRTRITLTGGVTAADTRKNQPRLQALMGADTVLWEYEDAGHLVLWAGNGCGTDRDEWARAVEFEHAQRLRLDEAWASAKAVNRDGVSVTTLSVQPAKGRLTRCVFRIPPGLGRDMVVSRLDGFCTAAGYAYSKLVPGQNADELVLLVCESTPLPDRAPVDWSLASPEASVLPFGVLDDGALAVFDPSQSPHLLASGTTGSGKSSVSVTLVGMALLSGWRVLVTDPSKGANDFKPLAPYVDAFEPSLPGCYALFRYAHEEMRRRVRLIGEHGGGDWSTLPDNVRPPRLLVFCDEFNSLLQKERANIANANDDPDVDNANALADWRNGLRSSIGLYASNLLTQARSAGITVVLGAQQLNAGDLDLLPNAGTAKGMLARVFLGIGNTQGNVSQANEREANRLHAQAARTGGMPKGRGLFENLGRGVDMVQCFWPGKGDGGLEALTSRLHPATPVDLSRYMPPEPELTGLADQTGVVAPAADPVVVDESGQDWEI